jgi:uncharacterized membrane protein YGL010W
MRNVTQWLGEYGESHRHAVNKLLHWICVPPIVLSVLGFLWAIPVPAVLASTSPWINWATLAALAALAYYVVLSPKLAVGIAIAFAALLSTVYWLGTLSWPLWFTSLVIFVVAWIGQFVGHAIEGKRPSFFKDVQFLLIGPLWLVAALYERIGLSYQTRTTRTI